MRSHNRARTSIETCADLVHAGADRTRTTQNAEEADTAHVVVGVIFLFLHYVCFAFTHYSWCEFPAAS